MCLNMAVFFKAHEKLMAQRVNMNHSVSTGLSDSNKGKLSAEAV